MRSQESIVHSHVALLIAKLQKHAAAKTPIDIVRWLNFTTFDVTGDLTLDASFGSLENEHFTSWVATLFKMVKFANALCVLRQYPIIGVPLMSVLKYVPALARARYTHAHFVRDKVERRLSSTSRRNDFLR